MRPLIIAAACLFVASTQADAATVSVTRMLRYPSTAQLADDPALYGHVIANYFVTTSTDILSINSVTITINGTTNGSRLYQHAAGSNVEPPNSAFVAVFPALGADSWITTPGTTSTAGGGFANPNSTWFDSDNNGAQTNFNFARLTFRFTDFHTPAFTVSTSNDDGTAVQNFPISFNLWPDFEFEVIVPEPATAMLAGVGLLPLAARRRRS